MMFNKGGLDVQLGSSLQKQNDSAKLVTFFESATKYLSLCIPCIVVAIGSVEVGHV
jgi:hypothetical protein